MKCIGKAICYFKTCTKGLPCKMAALENESKDKHKLKYTTKECVIELEKILSGNVYWEEVKKIMCWNAEKYK